MSSLHHIPFHNPCFVRYDTTLHVLKLITRNTHTNHWACHACGHAITYTVTYNPCQVTTMSFLQVSVFSGCQLGDYFPTQVASTKILVAMVPKVVAAWRIVVTKISS